MIEYENLVGRPFDLGRSDCFTLFRDFYGQNFAIKVPDFARPHDWNADELDLIGKLYPKVGMNKIDTWDLQPGDVLATAVGSSNPNHLIIYVGGNEILHHKTMTLSTVETMRPFWKAATCYVLRHPDVPDLTPVLPDVDIADLLSANYENIYK
jgi:cell wall-associated NlpC family hydrolase